MEAFGKLKAPFFLCIIKKVVGCG
jgi:hypothetical protein